MAVVYHALTWRAAVEDRARLLTAAGMAAARRDEALAALGRQALATAQAHRPLLAALGLEDADHLARWLVPGIVHPALVTVLMMVPTMAPLDTSGGGADRGDGVAAWLRGEGVGHWPGAPARERRLGLAPPGRWIAALVGATPFDKRPLPRDLGHWGRASGVVHAAHRRGLAPPPAVAALAQGSAWLGVVTVW